jgi:hypothetical protein
MDIAVHGNGFLRLSRENVHVSEILFHEDSSTPRRQGQSFYTPSILLGRSVYWGIIDLVQVPDVIIFYPQLASMILG